MLPTLPFLLSCGIHVMRFRDSLILSLSLSLSHSHSHPLSLSLKIMKGAVVLVGTTTATKSGTIVTFLDTCTPLNSTGGAGIVLLFINQYRRGDLCC